VRVVGEYAADLLDRHQVDEVASEAPIALDVNDSAGSFAERLSAGEVRAHAGYPVIENGKVVGVLMRRELVEAAPATRIGALVKRKPVMVFPDSTLRSAVEHMAREKVGRLPVVERAAPHRLIGILTRKDVVSIFARSAKEAGHRERGIDVRALRRRVTNREAV
jgi:predicted transcriptional regulator